MLNASSDSKGGEEGSIICLVPRLLYFDAVNRVLHIFHLRSKMNCCLAIAIDIFAAKFLCRLVYDCISDTHANKYCG